MKRRVIIIGLDGATFDLIDPLVARGKLPVIERLISVGTKARLLSTIPCATIPAWPSFMTGKNPGKHGVFDFFSFAHGERRISSSQDIRSLTLWEILSALGKRSVVMNVPGTYPPARIGGVVVSGMLTPQGAQFVSPPEARQLLDEAVDEYRVNFRSHLPGPKLLEDVYDVTQKQKAGLLALLGRQGWDLAMIMFRATDVIAHHFWEEQDVVGECYEYLDGAVGEIAGAFPDAALFLVSDHGFQAQRKDFHINKWLIDQGYMCIRKGQGAEAARWEEIGRLKGRAELAEVHIHPSSVFQVLLRLGLTGRKLRRSMPRAWWNLLSQFAPQRLRDQIPATADAGYEVDWERSRASAYQLYAMESKAIEVMNLDGSSRQEVCAELVHKLTALPDPQTGGPIVRRAYRAEELYVGPYVDRAPDIILDLHDSYNITNAFFADEYVTTRQHARGCHHQEGIFIASGSDIGAGKELDRHLSLMDVTPTVLHYMDSPVPNDCDGRVVKEVFDSASEVHRRPVVRRVFDGKEHVARGAHPYVEDEQAEIEERLKALGYL